MSRLRDRIEGIIRIDGPMSVAHYMTLCLHDPTDGYYATRPGLGRDFATAPEISQVFGELLGAWVVHEWRAMGAPNPVWLLELGPGRGVMMADLLRATRLDPEFCAAVSVALAEASPALHAQQRQRLAPIAPTFVRDLSDLPPGPVILLANEFLDCLPIRQAVCTPEGWRERSIGLGPTGGLSWGVGAPIDLPPDVESTGDSAEFAPALETLVRQVASRFTETNGRALFIDYGTADVSPGDTLRAFQQGAQVDSLQAPGEADLTADVDFGRLSRLARAAGLSVFGPAQQGAFLLQLGAAERAQALAAANPDKARSVLDSVQRLVHPADMGARFKVLAMAPRGAARPPGFLPATVP